MTTPARPSFRSRRPPTRNAPGPPPKISDDVTWTREVKPRETYRVIYVDRHDEQSERVIELLRIGNLAGTPYLGVMHQGRFKTLRTDRISQVLEQITTGHPPSITTQLRYSDVLPAFPIEKAIYRAPTIAKSNRTWKVDLNEYTCSCPEKRVRESFGYKPGQLGFVCQHIARAIIEHLPPQSDGWTPEILAFLNDPRRTRISALS